MLNKLRDAFIYELCVPVALEGRGVQVDECLVLTHYVTLGLRFCRVGIGNHQGVNYSHISIHGVWLCGRRLTSCPALPGPPRPCLTAVLAMCNGIVGYDEP